MYQNKIKQLNAHVDELSRENKILKRKLVMQSQKSIAGGTKTQEEQ